MPSAKHASHSMPNVMNVNPNVPSSSSDFKSVSAKNVNSSVPSRCSNPSTSKQVMQRVVKQTNVPIPSTGVISDIKASGSKPLSKIGLRKLRMCIGRE